MSGTDWTGDDSADGNGSADGDGATRAGRDGARAERRRDLARALARGGMDGVQVLSLESAETVLTPKRREIIDALRTTEVSSVRDLARRLDRDKGQVSRDLGVLAEHGVVTYESEGRAKRPTLTQEHIVVEPL